MLANNCSILPTCFLPLPSFCSVSSWGFLEGVLKFTVMLTLICASNSESSRTEMSVPESAFAKVSIYWDLFGRCWEVFTAGFCCNCQSIIICWASGSVILKWKVFMLKSVQNYQNWYELCENWRSSNFLICLSKEVNEHIWGLDG